MLIFVPAFQLIGTKFSQHSISGLILLIIRNTIGMVDTEKYIDCLTRPDIYYTYSFNLSLVHTFSEAVE
jgi:hypothetical protein